MNNLYDLDLSVNTKKTIFDQNINLSIGCITDIENSFNWSFFDNSFFTKNNIKLFTDTFVSNDNIEPFKSLLTELLIKYNFLKHSILQEIYYNTPDLSLKQRIEIFMRLFISEYKDISYIYSSNEYFLIEKYNLNRNCIFDNNHIIKNSKYYSWSNVFHSRFEFTDCNKLFNTSFNDFLNFNVNFLTKVECNDLNISVIYGINCLYYHIDNYINLYHFNNKSKFLKYIIDQNLLIIRKKVG